jgi:hypothetical protein
MIRVVMRVRTRWGGRVLSPGDSVTVPGGVAERWTRRGLADALAPDGFPEGFPGRDALIEAGFASLDGVPRDVGELVLVRGIGRATANRILDALGE